MDTTPEEPQAPEVTPQPAAEDVEQLVEQVRASGVRASLVRMGTPRPLPPGIGLTVYRICQEALTNVLKHAGPDPAVTVLVQWQPAALVLEVTDDGRGMDHVPPAPDLVADGHYGLQGIDERAAAWRGSVERGPAPGGGLRTRVTLALTPETVEVR